MVAYLNEEGLARFCTEDYKEPDPSNSKNDAIHLTNYTLNKGSDNFNLTEELTEINNGTKRTLASYWKSIEKEGYDKAIVFHFSNQDDEKDD